MNAPPLRLLFLCTGNSCRSIMAEGIANNLGAGRIRAFSAGSAPAGYVHPGSLACLAQHDMQVDDPRSKSWDEFAGQDFDVVVTVCDRAAGESCPLFGGPALKTHWGVPDPADVSGSEANIAAAFDEAFELLLEPIRRFVDSLDTGGDAHALNAAIKAAETC